MVVAIAGPPNAGKSTLLNRISRREAAIVSPYAGTTRDVIEVHLDLGGYPVTLLDTAGLRESVDPVEQEGVRRARQRAAAADLVLWVVDAREAPCGPLADGSVADRPSAPPLTWTVRNKIDLLKSPQRPSVNAAPGSPVQPAFAVSAAIGTGIEPLIDALAKQAEGFFGSGEPAFVTRARHRHALEETRDALQRALAEPANGREDIIAEELRLAARALGRLTGRVDVEDILDVIFRDFCIGK
jgi:tRNA modification GTPase